MTLVTALEHTVTLKKVIDAIVLWGPMHMTQIRFLHPAKKEKKNRAGEAGPELAKDVAYSTMALLRSSLSGGYVVAKDGTSGEDASWSNIQLFDGPPDKPTGPLICRAERKRVFLCTAARDEGVWQKLVQRHLDRAGCLAEFAGAMLDGPLDLPQTTQCALSLHSVVLEVALAMRQVLMSASIYTLADQGALRMQTYEQALRASRTYLSERFGPSLVPTPRDGLLMLVYVMGAWLLPGAIESLNDTVLAACLDLLRAIRGIQCCFRQDQHHAALPLPQARFGFSATAYANRLYSAVTRQMTKDAPYAQVSWNALAAQNQAMAEFGNGPLDIDLSHLVEQPALRSRRRRNAEFMRMLADPSTTPVPFPPYDSRYSLMELRDETDGGDFEQDGKLAVRRLCANKPAHMPLKSLPPCVARVMWHMSGEAPASDGLLHNEDRYHLANFYQDAGEFEVEDMEDMFRDTFHIDPEGGSRRLDHAMSHVRAHERHVALKRNRDMPPYVLPSCQKMGQGQAMRSSQLLRCPFSAQSGVSPDELAAILQFQGMSKAQASSVVATARRGPASEACLQTYQALAPQDARAPKPFYYPHFYSYHMARAMTPKTPSS